MKKELPKSSKKSKPFAPKFKPPALKPVDEVKGLFLQYFKKNHSAGQVMAKEDVIKHVLKKLTDKEDALFAEALRSLKREGIIEVQEDGVTLVLTQKGSDSFQQG